ncbi:YihY/virulence factor BrkB family protein [Comamonas sp. Y33R10-2]|uniref:YihY/virulence factor BrkB family protein n=1 Tax=Comamonas sp. Y33R10-2 TaxID=2853257 RepID=UPI001C5C9B46|nr:YihY/virulence factor BrkB family protein [Comamonas sp. Y33R10-2]QXZ08852.1 YihY/virulence factor BrkB family protein [Comamonas sp. Y33R10-2]
MTFEISGWKHKLQRLTQALQPLIDSVQLWLQADGLRMSAAMSFYGMLSLAPLLLAVVGLLGWWMDRSYVESTLISQVQSIVGERAAQVIQGALSSAQNSSQGSLASILGLVMMLSGATGVFVELQASLDKLWSMGEEPRPQDNKPWWGMAISRLWGLSYVVGLGFLLLVSMVLSTAIQMITTWANDALQLVPLGPLMGVINESLSFGIAVLLFWGLMRMGTGIKPVTKYLLLGSFMGAALFTVTKQALAWYLSTAAVVSAYGAAGSLVVVLMWFYVTSAILLFSAATAKACSKANVKIRVPFAPRPKSGQAQLMDLSKLPINAGENI